MTTFPLQQTKQWLKQGKHPLAPPLFKAIQRLRRFELPSPQWLLKPLYALYDTLRTLLTTLSRIFLWTPLLKGRLQQVGQHLYLYGGLPYISGPLNISLGHDCRLSGQTTFTGRTAATTPPLLQVGNNVDIGWMTTIAVGKKVILGNNVRIAGRALLAGYPGHPLNAAARASGSPDTEDQVANITLEDDVWLATGVSVMAGVCIGQGTVVAAGSVVTHDLPAGVLAAGVPARIIRSLPCSYHHPQEVKS